jgi:phosphoribosylanthranilate isomerase
MFVKICGLTHAADVAAALEAGADALGFVFAPSPREVTAEAAVALCAGVPASVVRVAVLHHPSAATWNTVRDYFAPDWIQTDAEDLAALSLPEGCRALPVYRTGRKARARDLPSRMLLEGAAGGRGAAADWEEAAELARGRELILAGGLNATNVQSAVARVRPWGVDVSSGVERSPGRKDPELIRDFITHARAAAKELL